MLGIMEDEINNIKNNNQNNYYYFESSLYARSYFNMHNKICYFKYKEYKTNWKTFSKLYDDNHKYSF